MPESAMHVLHVIDSLGRGGAERMLVDLANGAVRQGRRISVCLTREPDEKGAALLPELDSRIERHVLRRRGRFDLKALRQLGAIASRNGVDVLHAHSRSTFSLLALGRALRLVRVPILLQDHYGLIESDTAVPRWFPFAARYLDCYVGVHPAMEDWARQAGIPSALIHTEENSLDLERIHGQAPAALKKELSVRPGELLGVFVAGLRPEKGLDVLIEAVARLEGEKSAHFAIAGGARNRGYVEECAATVKRLGLESRVHFLGERQNVPALLRAADFGVLASRSESGPLVLVETLAAGLPVVASRAGSLAARVEKLGLPEFVTPGDASALAGALERLLALSPQQRKERGEAGYRLAMEHFDVSAALPRWTRYYEAARDGRRARS